MDNGVIVPSYMSMSDRGGMVDMGNQSDTTLRFGEVKAIVFPDDDKSISKRFIEYTVNVYHKDSSGPGSTQVYGGCVVSNGFGLGGDLIRYTLRPDAVKTDKNVQVGIGAKVLLLCINGDRPRAVIIGGLRDPLTQIEEDTVVDKEEDGHNLYFEFNGVVFKIDKEGKATLQFKGATDAKGKALEGNDEAAQPTTIIINKDGDFSITTKDDGQFIKIEHKDKKIRIKGDAKVIVECDLIHLGSEDPSDNLALASLVMKELERRKAWEEKMASAFDNHDHLVTGIQTAGAPTAHTQTAPVNTMSPGSKAPKPESPQDVKSEVVFSK